MADFADMASEQEEAFRNESIAACRVLPKHIRQQQVIEARQREYGYFTQEKIIQDGASEMYESEDRLNDDLED